MCTSAILWVLQCMCYPITLIKLFEVGITPRIKLSPSILYIVNAAGVFSRTKQDTVELCYRCTFLNKYNIRSGVCRCYYCYFTKCVFKFAS